MTSKPVSRRRDKIRRADIAGTLCQVTESVLGEMQRTGWYRTDLADGKLRYERPLPWDINSGWCESWAEVAKHALGDGAEVFWLDEIDPDLTHCVLLYRDRYYDAQVPEGVVDIRDLPLVQGVRRGIEFGN